MYVATVNNELYALNAVTGALVWRYSAGVNGDNSSSAAVANGVVYFGVDLAPAQMIALNANTGAVIWQQTLGDGGVSSPSGANDVLYVGCGSNVYALNSTTGAVLWNYPAGTVVNSSPTVVNGMVYFGSDNQEVYAFGLPNR